MQINVNWKTNYLVVEYQDFSKIVGEAFSLKKSWRTASPPYKIQEN